MVPEVLYVCNSEIVDRIRDILDVRREHVTLSRDSS